MNSMEELKEFSGRTNDVVNTLKSLKSFLSSQYDPKAKSFVSDIDCMIADVMIQDRKYYDIWKENAEVKQELKMAKELIGEVMVGMKKTLLELLDEEDSDDE